MTFNDKVVLVTGSRAGIGAAIALNFATEGAKVAIAARNYKKLKDVSEKYENTGSKPLLIIADMSKDEEAKRIVHETIERSGKLDVLVNNAGIANQASILSNDFVNVFDQVMSVNLRSIVVLTNLAAPCLVKTKGNIINISSVAAKKSFAVCMGVYSTSKVGLDHFKRCVALELARKGVRVNTVNRGPVKNGVFENSSFFSDNGAFLK